MIKVMNFFSGPHQTGVHAGVLDEERTEEATQAKQTRNVERRTGED